jgi:hypothetical protein
MKSPPLTLRFIAIALALNTSLNGQESTIELSEHTPFFSKISANYRSWLDEFGIASLVGIDTVVVTEDRLLFRMSIPDEKNYLYLDSIVVKNGWESLGAALFDRAMFLSELPPEFIRLKLDGKDVSIVIDYKHNSVVVKNIDKMGAISDELIIPVADLSNPRNLGVVNPSFVSLPDLKKKISEGLGDYFERRNKSWFQKTQLEDLSYNRSETLVLRITNMKGVVLQSNYFEYLHINFRFTTLDKMLKITFTVSGKYGAGILWAPFGSDYQLMSPEYDDALNTFVNEDLKNVIARLIGL